MPKQKQHKKAIAPIQNNNNDFKNFQFLSLSPPSCWCWRDEWSQKYNYSMCIYQFCLQPYAFSKFFTPVRHFIWTRSMWSYPCHNHCRSYMVSLSYVNLNSKHSHIESDNQKTIEVKKMPTWNHPIISIKMQNNCQCTSSKNYSEVCFILDGFTFISKENVQLFKVSHFSKYKYTFIP